MLHSHSHRGFRPRLQLERLEQRTLLHGSATLNAGVLQFDGDENANVMTIVLNNANQTIDVALDGEPATSFPVADVHGIRVLGLGGNDSITGALGITVPTTMDGGAGDDTIRGNQGPDTLIGGDGADSLVGGFGNDSLQGDAGNDTLRGRGGDDQAQGGDGNDLIAGTRGNDMLEGGGGNDSVIGRADNDIVRGGAGDDFVFGDYQFGSPSTTAGQNTLNGGNGDDVLVGGDTGDVLTGGNGRDIFTPVRTGGTRTDFAGADDFDAAGTVIASTNPDFEARHTGANLLGDRTDVANAPAVNNRPHVSEAVDYSAYSNPPTYGPHHDHGQTSAGHVNASSAPVSPTGIYTVELEDEDIIHNLEHGHVWISYDPDLISANDLASLQMLVQSFGPGRGVIMTPRAANGVAIAVASWARLQTLTNFDLAAVRAFILTNRGQAPEGFIP